MVFNELLSLLLGSSMRLFVQRLLELQCLSKEWSDMDNSHDEQMSAYAENDSDRETDCERVTESEDGEVMVKADLHYMFLHLHASTVD